MMLPELQDLAEFDAPEFGQDLTFLGNNDSDERLYLEDLSSAVADEIITGYELNDANSVIYGDSNTFDGTNGIRNYRG